MFYKMLYEKIGHLRPISDKKAKQRYCTVDQGRDGFRERGVLGHLSFGGPKHMWPIGPFVWKAWKYDPRMCSAQARSQGGGNGSNYPLNSESSTINFQVDQAFDV